MIAARALGGRLLSDEEVPAFDLHVVARNSVGLVARLTKPGAAVVLLQG